MNAITEFTLEQTAIDWFKQLKYDYAFGPDLYRKPGNERQSDGVLQTGLETLLKGVFNRQRFLDYILNFITFEDDGGDTTAIA